MFLFIYVSQLNIFNDYSIYSIFCFPYLVILGVTCIVLYFLKKKFEKINMQRKNYVTISWKIIKRFFYFDWNQRVYSLMMFGNMIAGVNE